MSLKHLALHIRGPPNVHDSLVSKLPNETVGRPTQAFPDQIWIRAIMDNGTCILDQNCSKYKDPHLIFACIWKICPSWLVWGQIWQSGTLHSDIMSYQGEVVACILARLN